MDEQPTPSVDLDRLVHFAKDELREVVVAGLLQRKADVGFLTDLDYQAAGLMVKRDKRTVYRWVQEAKRREGMPDRDRHGPRDELSKLHIATYWAHGGRKKASWEDLSDHGLYGKSLATWKRSLDRLDSRILNYPKMGYKAIRSGGLYPTWSATTPWAIWQADVHTLDIWCLLDGVPIRPFWVDAIDDCTRYMPAGIVTADRPTARDVQCMLSMGMRLRTDKFGTTVGGIPHLLLVDNGMEFCAEEMDTAAVNLDMKIHWCALYEPTAKGKKERHYRSLEEEGVRKIHGWTTWTALTKDMQPLFRGDPKKLPSFKTVCDGLNWWANWYNDERPHQGLGGKTPAQALASHEREIREASRAMLARSFTRPTRQPSYKVHPSGLNYEGHYYWSIAIAGHVGKQVIIHKVPYESALLEVFNAEDYTYLGTVYESADGRTDERKEVLAERGALLATVKELEGIVLASREDRTAQIEGPENPSLAVAVNTTLSASEAEAASEKAKADDSGIGKRGRTSHSLIPGWDDVRAYDPNDQPNDWDDDTSTENSPPAGR